MVRVRCVQKAQFGATAIYLYVQIIKFGAITFFLVTNRSNPVLQQSFKIKLF